MHRSRLAGLIIDCQDADLEDAASFWGQALGFAVKRTEPPDPKYLTFDTGEDLHIEVQRVSHPSRVHLDIEATDVDAEVRRLEKLGARRIEQVKTWWVMEAPTGQRFCVVRQQRGDLPANGNAWDDQGASLA